MNDPNLLSLNTPHLLQSPLWGQFKAKFGWEPEVFRSQSSQAQVLFRKLPLGLSLAYLPKGPVGEDWASLWPQIDAACKRRRAVFLQVEPDLAEGDLTPDIADQLQGFIMEPHTIQPRNTILVDLQANEEELLAHMKQKTRYNIRLSARKGVHVRQGAVAELPMLYKMYAETAVRDGFVIRHEGYYLNTWREFIEADMAKILIAEVESQPIAALILFHFNGTARYMFGMSTENSRDLMPNYLLQWEAMRQAKQLGCHTYDMWGAPEIFDESDSMWGVYRFKEGFNGIVTRTLGAWDYTTRPWLYHRYTETLPKLLNLLRRRGLKANKRSLND